LQISHKFGFSAPSRAGLLAVGSEDFFAVKQMQEQMQRFVATSAYRGGIWSP